VILSQFFAGIAKGLKGIDQADVPTLGAALQEGVKKAYASVMKPTEGTILTVAREGVEAAVAGITAESTVESLFTDLIKEIYLDTINETVVFQPNFVFLTYSFGGATLSFPSPLPQQSN
jgi:dihydroxyacetone kinase-like predicted kinase